VIRWILIVFFCATVAQGQFSPFATWGQSASEGVEYRDPFVQYTFDEPYGPLNDASTNRNFMYYDTATFETNRPGGLSGVSLLVNGGFIRTYQAVTNVCGTNSITWITWVCATNCNTNTSSYFGPWSYNANNEFYQGRHSPSNKCTMYLRTGDSILGTMGTNEWHHYAMTFDNATKTFVGYWDGVPVATNSKPTQATRVTLHWLGSYSDTAHFEGYQYDSLAYRGVVTEAEIGNHYTNNIKPTSLPTYFDMHLDASVVGIVPNEGTNSSFATLTNYYTTGAWPMWEKDGVSSGHIDCLNDYCEETNGFGATSNFSFSGWFYPETTNRLLYYVAALKTAGGPQGTAIRAGGTYNSGNHVPYSICIIDDDAIVASTISNTWGFVNEWKHLAVTYDANLATNNWKVYINATEQTMGVSYDTNGIGANTGWVLGHRADKSSWYYDGKMDDVRFYDYTLSSNHVLTIYSGGRE